MSEPTVEKALWRYCRRVLVALDQFGNALAGGEPDQTISYRAAAARAAGSRGACLLCRLLDLFQRDHCGRVLAGRSSLSPEASI